MNQYIVLLRGINVSGQKLIKMADLRELLSKKGYSNVQTYIQSGNILLCSNESKQDVASGVHGAIQQKYGFDVSVLTISEADLDHSIEQNPFKGEAQNFPKKVYFTFLSGIPDPKLVKELEEVDVLQEFIKVLDSTVYFFSENPYGNAKMSNNFVERKLKMSGTSRNFNTVMKLKELVGK